MVLDPVQDVGDRGEQLRLHSLRPLMSDLAETCQPYDEHLAFILLLEGVCESVNLSQDPFQHVGLHQEFESGLNIVDSRTEEHTKQVLLKDFQ